MMETRGIVPGEFVDVRLGLTGTVPGIARKNLDLHDPGFGDEKVGNTKGNKEHVRCFESTNRQPGKGKNAKEGEKERKGMGKDNIKYKEARNHQNRLVF